MLEIAKTIDVPSVFSLTSTMPRCLKNLNSALCTLQYAIGYIVYLVFSTTMYNCHRALSSLYALCFSSIVLYVSFLPFDWMYACEEIVPYVKFSVQKLWQSAEPFDFTPGLNGE